MSKIVERNCLGQGGFLWKGRCHYTKVYVSMICSNDGWTGILCHGFESAVGVISKEILQYIIKY